MKQAVRVTFALITMLVIIAVSAVMVFVPGPTSWVDDTGSAPGTAVSQTVSPSQFSTYCPAPMDLTDSDAYGDSAFQASVGNQSTRARYAAFGSVYRSTVTPFDTSQDTDEETLSLDASESESSDTVMVGAENLEQSASSRVMDTRLLESGQGAGSAGASASWATDGDLKGVNASSCVSTDISHAFLLRGTITGTTQQLIVANPSSKDTSVDIQIWGSDDSGAMSLATSSTLAVPALGEAMMNLSAAAAGQDGVYVTVSSEQTPVAAVVSTIVMDGLTSKGSDFALPLAEPRKTSVVPAVVDGDYATAYLFARQDTTVELSWVTPHGLVDAEKLTVTAQRVSVVDLGEAPDDALAVLATAEADVDFSVASARSGADGQEDFALTNASAPVESSGVALPGGVSARAVLANTANREQSATIRVYDESGDHIRDREITLGANSAVIVDIDDLAGEGTTAAALVVDGDSRRIGWAVRLTNSQVSQASLAGLSTLGAASLMPQETNVWARSRNGLIP